MLLSGIGPPERMRSPVWYVEGFTSSGKLESDGMRSWPKAERRNPSGMRSLSLSLFFSPPLLLRVWKNSCCYNSAVDFFLQPYMQHLSVQTGRQVHGSEVWRRGVTPSDMSNMKAKGTNSLTCTDCKGKKKRQLPPNRWVIVIVCLHMECFQARVQSSVMIFSSSLMLADKVFIVSIPEYLCLKHSFR